MADGLWPVVKDGCGVFGVLRKEGAERIGNSVALMGIECARYRGSDLGAGFASFRANRESWPPYRVKMFVKDDETLQEIRSMISSADDVKIVNERVPSFYDGRERFAVYTVFIESSEETLSSLVNTINSSMWNSSRIRARVYSYGRYVNVYKDIGYPIDIAKKCNLIEDRVFADAWIAHTRQPTNSPGSYPVWSHPFASFEFGIVHNGDISSFGSNMELLNSVGMKSHVGTDSEVIVRLLDHLVRVYGLAIDDAARILSNPFEEDLRGRNGDYIAERRLVARLRGAQLDGPFTAIAGYCDGDDAYLLGLVDRSKFRPVVVGEDEERFFVASEESQIRAISHRAKVWTLEPGNFFLCSMKRGLIESGRRNRAKATATVDR